MKHVILEKRKLQSLFTCTVSIVFALSIHVSLFVLSLSAKESYWCTWGPITFDAYSILSLVFLTKYFLPSILLSVFLIGWCNLSSIFPVIFGFIAIINLMDIIEISTFLAVKGNVGISFQIMCGVIMLLFVCAIFLKNNKKRILVLIALSMCIMKEIYYICEEVSWLMINQVNFLYLINILKYLSSIMFFLSIFFIFCQKMNDLSHSYLPIKDLLDELAIQFENGIIDEHSYKEKRLKIIDKL